MKTEKTQKECYQNKHIFKHHNHNNSSGAIYGLGVIGALFYFLQHATTFSLIAMGVGKAVFWPALVIFKVLTLLQL